MNTANITISPVNVEERKKIDLRSGDTVKVWQKIKEGDKIRLQALKVLCLPENTAEKQEHFYCPKSCSGVGVEKIFPLYSHQLSIRSKSSAEPKSAEPSSITYAKRPPKKLVVKCAASPICVRKFRNSKPRTP
jgi:ribosomal protein L19